MEGSNDDEGEAWGTVELYILPEDPQQREFYSYSIAITRTLSHGRYSFWDSKSAKNVLAIVGTDSSLYPVDRLNTVGSTFDKDYYHSISLRLNTKVYIGNRDGSVVLKFDGTKCSFYVGGKGGC